MTVEAAYIGTTDLNIDLNEVINTFGCFLKHEVKPNAGTNTSRSSRSNVSAFTIMMAVQREQCRARLPDKLDKDTLTLKEKLYNNVIDLLDEYYFTWKGRDAVNSYGVRLVKELVE